jgi:hypothetical protein
VRAGRRGGEAGFPVGHPARVMTGDARRQIIGG